MRILIKDDVLKLDSRSIPVSGGYGKGHKLYRESLSYIAGKWLDVDTRYEFENSYNVIDEKGDIISIPKEYVAEIDRG